VERRAESGETAGTESERNAAAEPQTEGRRTCGKSNAARDERTACEAERSNPSVAHGEFTYNKAIQIQVSGARTRRFFRVVQNSNFSKAW
jgi:hypothetical protein